MKTKVTNFGDRQERCRGEVQRDRRDRAASGGQRARARIRWLELLKAIDACLPAAEEPKPIDEKATDKAAARAAEIMQRPELHIINVDSLEVDDIAAWKTATDPLRAKAAEAAGAGAKPAADPPADSSAAAAASKGPTWIIQIAGRHYHNADRDHQGAEYLNETLIKALRTKTIELPREDGAGKETVRMDDLGISCATIVRKSPHLVDESLVDPNIDAGGGVADDMMGNRPHLPPREGNSSTPNIINVKRFDFVVQFIWQPKTPLERRKAKEAREAAEKAKQAAQATTPKGQP